MHLLLSSNCLYLHVKQLYFCDSLAFNRFCRSVYEGSSFTMSCSFVVGGFYIKMSLLFKDMLFSFCPIKKSYLLIIWRHIMCMVLLWTCCNKSVTQYVIHIKITVYIKIIAYIKIILILEKTCFGRTFFANYLDV